MTRESHIIALIGACLYSACAVAADVIYVSKTAGGKSAYTVQPVDASSRAIVMALTSTEVVATREATVRRALSTGQTVSSQQASIGDMVRKVADEYSVNSALVLAVIAVESNFNTNAVSPKGALGLMQLMPGTAKRFGVGNAFDPEQNIRGGVRYLSELADMFDNDLDLVLAAYNAGENAVLRYKLRVPPFPETINYVKQVRQHLYRLLEN